MAKSTALRRKRKGRFIMKHAEWMESPAYRDLKTPARALLDEFLLIYRPGRNGHLSISTRNAASLIRVTEETVSKAFHELVEHGFLVLVSDEGWMERKAREWRLTIEQCNDREPTDDWRRWEPNKPVAFLPRKKYRHGKQGQHCTKNGGRLPEIQGQSKNN